LDPFLVQSSHPSVLRPATALQADLAAVLREGRVLAGEVLQALDGGTVLIGIGSHRVAAHSQVEMQPGHRFLFQVESSAEATLLRVLGESSSKEHALLAALRNVLDQQLPMGELLTQLALQLESAARQASSSGPGTEALRELLGALDGHVFDPNQGAARLKQVLQQAGFDHEADLARLALDSGPRPRIETFLAELRTSLLRGLAGGNSPLEGFAAELQQALWSEIASVFDQSDRVQLTALLEGGGLDSLARDLEALLERALRSMAGTQGEGAEGRIPGAVRHANLGSLVNGLRRELLRSLLGLQPPEASPSEVQARLLARLESDLKGRLLRSLDVLPEGPLRDAVARSLGGIEAEQLLNLARREGNQSQHWTLALPDGSAWTSAHLSYQRLGGRAGGGSRAQDRSVHRVVIAVEFSHTGAVRADLLVRSESLTARLRVARPEVARLLRARAGQLEQGLAGAGRRVHLSIEEVPEADVRVEEHVQDVSWLFEHHVMDRLG
jgi:hypothetical protein